MERTPSFVRRAAARALRPFAPVEPDETPSVLVLTLTVFLLLCAYYLLKTAREPLILLDGGAEVKSYAAAGQALVLLVFVRAYGAVAKRVGRLRLLATVYLFFGANLVAFAALAAMHVRIGVPFYLWVGVFNYTAIAQFWAFAADVYGPEQGKRLFAILGIGSSLGAVAGARVAGALVPLGAHALMLGAAVLLVACVALIAWVDRRARGERARDARPEEPIAVDSVLKLLARDRFLLLLAALTLLLNWVNSNGEYLLDRTLLDTLAREGHAGDAAAFIGRFKADYFAWVNAVGMMLQLFVVSRVLTRLGPRVALLFLPVVAFGGYALLLGAPVLALIRAAKIAENSLDYSIQNTARQALYLVANRVEKFVGKTAVDTFFVRFGDVLSAALVWTGTRLALTASAFAWLNLALIAVWIGVVVRLGREHERRSEPMQEACALKTAAVAGVILAVLALTSDARADSPKRALPDYDGRDDKPATAGELALWAPRLTLAPAYLASEYVVRRPLGAMVAGAERAGLPESLYNFFFFGPDHKAGFVPIAFVDFGFHPDVGVYAFWDDAIVRGHDLRLHASGWDSEWLAGVFTDRVRFRRGESVELTLSGIRRPDLMFFGVGPNATKSNESRYGEDRLEARALGTFPLWRASRVEASVGVRSLALYHGHFGGDPSIEERAASGAFPAPYGFGRGYTAQTSRVLAALDTRLPRPAPGSGVRVEVEAEEGADVRRNPGSAWIKYGATAGAFLDLNGRNRVLSVSLTTQFADPLGHAPIPFTELVSLGGTGPMRGLYPGRLVDRSAAVATVHYRWPIWVWLDGSVQVATGSVFGDHLDQFDPSRLRMSGAIGVESIGSRDSSFELLIGVGTETIDQGAKLDSVRIAVGSNRGF